MSAGATILLANGTAAAIAAASPALGDGEPAFATDTHVLIIGFGGVQYTIGGGGGGDALVANPLSQFAATTSAQLAGVLSDETGTGLAVFNTSPTLVTPLLGTPTSGNLANCAFPPLNTLTAPTGDVSLNTHKITNLLDPTAAQDAATKAYVDAVATGLDVKASCRVATTANIALTGTQTIDGVAVVAGERVFVKAQTTANDNGLYVCAAGAWARSTDANTSALVTSGLFSFISEGTTLAGTGWLLTTADPITLGTTALVFAQFTGGGTYSAGTGLTLTGTVFAVNYGTTATTACAGNDSRLGTVTNGLTYKSNVNCSANPNYPAGVVGDAYSVKNGGKIGGAAGTVVDVGDWYVCISTNAGGDEATVGLSWGHMEHNLVGALTAAQNLSDVASVATARTNLGLGTLATQSGTFSGTSSGTNTGDQTSVSGNAGTATALAVSQLINGVGFNGTASITITADSTPFTGLTAADIALTDALPEYNAAATANRKVTVDRLLGFGNPILNDLHLSLVNGVSVPGADVVAATTLYLNPALSMPGQTIVGSTGLSIFDGTRHRKYNLSASLSLSLAGLVPGLYDVFVWDNAGTLTLETLAWSLNQTGAVSATTNAIPIVVTSASHNLLADQIVFIAGVSIGSANGIFRVGSPAANSFPLLTLAGNSTVGTGTGSGGNWYRIDAAGSLAAPNTRATALDLQDGVLYKHSALTRRYLGTIYVYQTGKVDDSAQKRHCWNLYNRYLQKIAYDTSAGHTYTGAAYRAWNNDLTHRCEFVSGLDLGVQLGEFGHCVASVAGQAAIFALGIDTIVAASNDTGFVGNYDVNRIYAGTSGQTNPGIGLHYAQLVEYGSTTASFAEAHIRGSQMG